MAEQAWIGVEMHEEGPGRPVALVTFDRPPVNAIDATVKDEIIAVAAELSRMSELGAVVLQGARSFAAGDDIKEMAAADRAHVARGRERISEACSAVAAIPVPVVAAVRGHALGGGCELALAADFRVTARDAVWGLPEVHLGLVPAGGGTQRLPRLIGPARAKRMIYLGDTVSGEEAVEWGLADEAVAADQVTTAAIALAKELASRAPLAVRAAKQAVDAGLDGSLAEGLRLESALFAAVFATDDAAEGLTAFLARGPRQATFDGH